MRKTVYTTKRRMERLAEELNFSLTTHRVWVKLEYSNIGMGNAWTGARIYWNGNNYGSKEEEADLFINAFNEAMEFVNYINYSDFMVVPEGPDIDDSIFDEFFLDEFYEAKADHYFEPMLNRLLDIYNKVNIEEVEVGGKTIRRIWSYDDEMEDAS